VSPVTPRWLTTQRPRHDHSWQYIVQTLDRELQDGEQGIRSAKVIASEEARWAREMTAHEHMVAAAFHVAKAQETLAQCAEALGEKPSTLDEGSKAHQRARNDAARTFGATT